MLAAFYEDRTAKCTAKCISFVLKDFAEHYEMHQGNNQGNIFVLAAFYEDRTAKCISPVLKDFGEHYEMQSKMSKVSDFRPTFEKRKCAHIMRIQCTNDRRVWNFSGMLDVQNCKN